MRLISGLFYGALGTLILIAVGVLLFRLIGAHGGSIGAAAESTAAHVTGLNL